MFENAYALVIGIARYLNVTPLRKTLNDARDIHDLLVDDKYCGYVRSNVTLLEDQAADKDGILAALDELAARANPQSTAFIFMACHGWQIESGPFAGQYILPVSADFTDEQTVSETAISGNLFTEKLRNIKSRKLSVILDCCHSGGIGQPRRPDLLKRGLSEELYTQLAAGQGRVIVSSAGADEAAWELAEDRNGLFTKHLLAGLRGHAGGDDEFIRIFGLYDYVQQQVFKESSKRQNPMFKAEARDNFPLALRLGGTPRASTGLGNFMKQPDGSSGLGGSMIDATSLSEEEILGLLKRLERAEYDELLFRIKMPKPLRPAKELTLGERAVAVLEWAMEKKSGVGIEGLREKLQQILASR